MTGRKQEQQRKLLEARIAVELDNYGVAVPYLPPPDEHTIDLVVAFHSILDCLEADRGELGEESRAMAQHDVATQALEAIRRLDPYTQDEQLEEDRVKAERWEAMKEKLKAE